MKNITLAIFALSCLGLAEISAQSCISGNCDNGFGTLRISSNSRYEGYFKNKKYEGKGTLYYSNGDRYEGEFANNLPDGFGIRISQSGTANGGKWAAGSLQEPDPEIRFAKECLRGDCKNGPSKLRDYKGRIYEGQFKNYQLEGYGTIQYPNGDHYDGLFQKGLPHGKGTYFYKNGHTDAGDWKNGHFQNANIRTWAVIVGVADYQNFPKLTYTIDDAKKVYGFFRSPEGGAVPSERIKLLLDKEATKENILNTTFEIFQTADSADIIIFYFAGHGVEGAFVPFDYDGSENSLLPHALVHQDFLDSKAKFKLCIADACHSGSYKTSLVDPNDESAVALSRSTIRDQIKAHYKSFENIKGGLAIIASSAPEEVSLEATKLKQGVFSYFFILGLKGQADENENGIVTASELYAYIFKHVQSYTYKFQTPLIFGDFDPNMPIGLTPEKK